jgi:hypothetical protein
VTGHNHTQNCLCGWCVYSDRVRRRQQRIGLNEAKLLLKKHGVTSKSSCLVIPNARCPVCQAFVFYYSNDFGSRVFFDQLGPPWPKHGCTDNPRTLMPRNMSLKLRDAALAERLLASAQVVREIRGNFYPSSSDYWEMLQIEKCILDGQNRSIKTRYVNPRAARGIEFNLAPSSPNFEIGDLLYLKGEDVEFLDRKTLKPQKFYAALTSTILIKNSGTSMQPVPPFLRYPSRASFKAYRQLAAMPTQFAVYFPNDPKELDLFLDRIGQIIDNYRSLGIKGKNELAKRLSDDGHRTSNGYIWTRRLTDVLLSLLIYRKTFLKMKNTFRDKGKPISSRKNLGRN